MSENASSPVPAAGPKPHTRALRCAMSLALFGLVLTIIHLAWPSPLMFTVFMMFGQSAFGVAMAIYAWVIFVDLRHRKAL